MAIKLRSFAVCLAPVAVIDAGKVGNARGAREVLPPIQRDACSPRAVCVFSRSSRWLKAIAPASAAISGHRAILASSFFLRNVELHLIYISNYIPNLNVNLSLIIKILVM